MEAVARLGLRELALARRTNIPSARHNEATLECGEFEQDLTFRGRIGRCDPPRPGASPFRTGVPCSRYQRSYVDG
jgi:magnesium-transporting ATPase (P-type)